MYGSLFSLSRLRLLSSGLGKGAKRTLLSLAPVGQRNPESNHSQNILTSCFY